MIRLLPLLLLGLLWTGCARRYEILLPNDRMIVTASKPKLIKEERIYVYKDAKGREHYIPAVRVMEIRAK